jgi:type VI secretion system protein ImpJ
MVLRRDFESIYPEGQKQTLMVQDKKKIIWREGMTLDPHHFQQWDRHQQSVLNARTRAVAPYGWGVSHITFDEERLANGELALLECSGIMADGLVFDVPESGSVPEVRNVQAHMPATEERIGVRLAIPSARQGERNVRLQGGANQRETRFVAESMNVSDENTGANERPIEVARTNVQLRFANESQQGYSTMPVAEIVRTGGGFSLSDSFVPPSLRIGASGRLMHLTRQMIELLVAKSSDLTERQRNAFSQRELSPADVRAIQLLGAVNTYIPRLNNQFNGAVHHPERLFETLLALAGQLSAYVEKASVRPRDYPVYNHVDATASFNRIQEILLEMLGEATPSSNYERLSLERRRENLLITTVRRELLDNAQLFLATRSDHHSEQQLTESLPSMLRIATPSTIDGVLQMQVKALTVTATRRLPIGVPVDNRATYFRLEKHGEYWESIREEGAIAVFLPSGFSRVEVNLMAVM